MIQNNNTDFKTKKKIYKNDSLVYFFYRIVIRMSVFFFLVVLSMLVFYFVGNYQDFLDTNQKLILNLTAIVSVTSSVFLLLGIILNIVTFIVLKRNVYRFIIYTLLYLLMLSASVAVFFISRSVLLLSNGL